MENEKNYLKFIEPGEKYLFLIESKKWFDLIAIEAKKEIYRKITPYYFKRLIYFDKQIAYYVFKPFNKIVIRNGYNSNSPLLITECKGIKFQKGVRRWGGNPSILYYTILVGKIIYNGSEYFN